MRKLIICGETVTVQPRTLHLLQSPYKHVNLAKKESAPRRRRFGMGRFRNGLEWADEGSYVEKNVIAKGIVPLN